MNYVLQTMRATNQRFGGFLVIWIVDVIKERLVKDKHSELCVDIRKDTYLQRSDAIQPYES